MAQAPLLPAAKSRVVAQVLSLEQEELISIAAEARVRSTLAFLFACGLVQLLMRLGLRSRHLGAALKLSDTRVCEMAQIWRRIVLPALSRGVELPLFLSREFYHHALRSPEPLEAVLYAGLMKSRNPGFTCMDFRKATAWGLPVRLRSCLSCKHFERRTSELLIVAGSLVWRKKLPVRLCRKENLLLGVELEVDPVKEATFCSGFSPLD